MALHLRPAPHGPARRGGLLRLNLALAGLAALVLLTDGGGSGGEGGSGGTGTGTGTGGDGGQGTGGAGGDEPSDDAPAKGAAKVEMTQAELDDLINKKVGKAKGTAEADFKKWLDDQAKDETTKEKDRADAAEQASADAIKKANDRLVVADAKVAALDLGANPAKVSALIKLADLSKVDVDDETGPDADDVKKAMTKALKEYPEFKAGATAPAGPSGGDHNDDEPKKASGLQGAVAKRLAGTGK